MDWTLWIGPVGTIVAIVCSVVALIRNSRQDVRSHAVMDAEVRTRLGHIATGVDDIKSEQRAMRGEVGDLATRVTRVEESVKQAHKRMDRQEAGATGE